MQPCFYYDIVFFVDEPDTAFRTHKFWLNWNNRNIEEVKQNVITAYNLYKLLPRTESFETFLSLLGMACKPPDIVDDNVHYMTFNYLENEDQDQGQFQEYDHPETTYS